MRIATFALIGVCLIASEAAAMNPSFEKARAAFRKDVAALHHQPEASFSIEPSREDAVGFAELRTGQLFAFEAHLPIEPRPAHGQATYVIRGWASPSGEVVLEAKDNLQLLFRAAHFLDAAHSVSAKEMADRLIWMMLERLGRPQPRQLNAPPTHQLMHDEGAQFIAPPDGHQGEVTAPKIERRPDGGADLMFFYTNLDSVFGGVVGPYRAEIVCKPGYHLTLSVAPIKLFP
jgi:hypothetical protein